MNTKWEERTLDELCSVITDGAHRSPKSTVEGIPMASVKDMTSFGIDYDSARTISKEEYETLKKSGCCPQIGDVLIAKDGSVLESVCVHNDQREICLLSSIAIFRPGENLDPYFLKYFFESPKTKYIAKNGYITGSAIPRIVLKDFKQFPIKLPNIDQQKVIANFLKKIDEKIEVNQKENNTLEEMAKTLFKSWLIDFDPINAKEKGISSGLSDEISNLFPNAFKDSEIGRIPLGWEVKSLDEIADYLNGLALQKFPSKGDKTDLPVIKIAQLRSRNTIESDKCSNELEEKYIIQDGDVLFSWSGSLLVDLWTGDKGALNQHLFKITSKNFSKWFFLFWTKYHLKEFQEIAKSKATTLGHIQRKHLSEAKVVIPSNICLSKMNEIFNPIIEKQIKSRLESRTLSHLRDTLLPKLITGEIKISDTEKMIEKVEI